MVHYVLPPVKPTERFERRCWHCQYMGGQIHSGQHHRPIRDIRLSQIPIRRMYCPACGTTWTVRPGGVGPGRQRTDRLRGLGVMFYMLGLSYRAVEAITASLECGVGKSTVERDVAEAGQKAEELHQAGARLKIKLVSVDGTGAAMAGQNRGMLFCVDPVGGRLLRVVYASEEDLAAVRKHIREVMASCGAQVLRTDEHSVYQKAAEQLGIPRHELCAAHWLKSKQCRVRQLREQACASGRTPDLVGLDELREILRHRPRSHDPPEELMRLVRRYIGCRAPKRGGPASLPYRIKQLLLHVERTWSRVSRAPDPTNNTTERLIGLCYKIRAKTMRGFKSPTKARQHPYLSSFLRAFTPGPQSDGQEGLCRLAEVL